MRNSSPAMTRIPVAILQRTFEETDGYDEMVVLRDIRFESHCEHHMVPIIGRAHIAYLPRQRVIGISKLARLLEVYSHRLQIQEKLTAQIAKTIDQVLQPKGVGVIIDASHQCMTTRGVHKPGMSMVTSHMLGTFRSDPRTQARVPGHHLQPRHHPAEQRMSASKPRRQARRQAAALRLRARCWPASSPSTPPRPVPISPSSISCAIIWPPMGSKAA